MIGIAISIWQGILGGSIGAGIGTGGSGGTPIGLLLCLTETSSGGSSLAWLDEQSQSWVDSTGDEWTAEA